MSEYATDCLNGWIRAGMPYSSHRIFKETCTVCDRYCRTLTGNWTACEETGARHNKGSSQ